MTQKEIQTNFELSTDFNKYIVRHPEMARRIASNAVIVFASPAYPEVTKKNLQLAERIRKQGGKKKLYRVVKTAKGWNVEPLRT